MVSRRNILKSALCLPLIMAGLVGIKRCPEGKSTPAGFVRLRSNGVESFTPVYDDDPIWPVIYEQVKKGTSVLYSKR